MNKITTNQLTPDTIFRITGRTDFCRIAKKVDGDELEKENKARKDRGWIPVDKPHTRLTIFDAQVMFANGPQNPTVEEAYAIERMFQTKTHGQSNCFTGMNKGNGLPFVYYQPDPTTPAVPVTLERDLASGLRCTMFLKVFKSSMNNGVSLEGIILHDPVKYFSGGNDGGASMLAQFGINIDPSATSTAQPEYPGYDPDIIPPDELGYNNANAQAPYTNNAPQQGGYANQAPQGGYPNQAPQGGYANQAPQGGYQNQAPAPQGGYQNNGQPQGGNPGQTQFNGYNNAPPAQQNTGIRYDPNAPQN